MSLKKNEIAACVVIAAGIALALAVGAGVFPTAAVAAMLSPPPAPGPPTPPARVPKHTQLPRTEEELGDVAQYLGMGAFFNLK